MTQSTAGKPLPKRVKILIVTWLVLTLLGALSHNILPNAGIDFTIQFPPHLRYGYVMFNKSAGSVAVISYQKEGEVEWRHVAELVETPAPFYKRTRVLVDIWITGFQYLDYLCKSRRDASEAFFRIEHYNVGFTTEEGGVEQLLCHNGELLSRE